MVASSTLDLPSVVVTSDAENGKVLNIKIQKLRTIKNKSCSRNIVRLTICSRYFWCWKWKSIKDKINDKNKS